MNARFLVVATFAAVCLSDPTQAQTAGESTLRLGKGPVRAMPAFVQVTDLGDSVYVLSAGTANVTACLTDSGWVVVDTGTRMEAAAIREEIRRIAQRPFLLVVDTHVHDDHAGGNALYAGMGVPVWATKSARVLAKERARRVEAGAPKEIARLDAYRATLPKDREHARAEGFVSFFADWWREALEDVRREPGIVRPPDHGFAGRLVRRIGNTRIDLIAVPGRAHTGGDCVVVFPERKAAAVGDVFAKGSAPWADQFMADGSLEGVLNAQDSLLAWLPADSTWRIVPGHGPVARRADLTANRAALDTLRACVRRAYDARSTREAAARDCAGEGFSEDQGDYAAWLFYEEWARMSRKGAPATKTSAKPVHKSLTNE